MKNWYSFYSERERSTTTVGFASSIFYHLAYICTILRYRPKRVLEVGCGRGVTSVFLSFFVPLCVGIDLEPDMVTLARRSNKKFHGRAHFYIMNGKKTSFSNNAFEIVCSQGLLEHYDDKEVMDFIEEWLRVAPACVISVPSKEYGRKEFGNERLLTIQDYEKILKRYRVTCFYYGFLPHERSFSARNFLSIYKAFNPRKYRSQIVLTIKRDACAT